MEKQALRYLLFFGAILLVFKSLAYSADGFEDKYFRELNLVNPSETLKKAKVRVTHSMSVIIIFHSRGVMNAEPKRFPKEILDKFNFYSDERVKHHNKMVEYWKKRRIEDEKKLEEVRRIAEEKARQEAINENNERLNRRMEDSNMLSEEQAKPLLERFREAYPQDNRSDIEIIGSLGRAYEAKGVNIEEVDPAFSRDYDSLKRLSYPSLGTEYIRGIQRGIAFYTGMNENGFSATIQSWGDSKESEDNLRYMFGFAGVLTPTAVILAFIGIGAIAIRKKTYHEKESKKEILPQKQSENEHLGKTDSDNTLVEDEKKMKSNAAKYGARAFVVIVVLMALNVANCSAGRELGADEYIVRVVITTLLFGLPTFFVVFLVQKFRERSSG